MYEKHFFILPKGVPKQNGDTIPTGLFLTIENNWLYSFPATYISCPTNTDAVKEVMETMIPLLDIKYDDIKENIDIIEVKFLIYKAYDLLKEGKQKESLQILYLLSNCEFNNE